jgi:hypothetical protein
VLTLSRKVDECKPLIAGAVSASAAALGAGDWDNVGDGWGGDDDAGDGWGGDDDGWGENNGGGGDINPQIPLDDLDLTSLLGNSQVGQCWSNR